jgi:hypothetical protein
MPEVITQLQRQMETGGELPVKELRDATWQAARYVVFALGSGNPDQLGPLCNTLTQLTERYFDSVPQDGESPHEWMRSLAVIGQIATGAYESFGPSAEARKVLEGSEHARNIVKALLGEDLVQAKELRSLAGIEHQSAIARIMHTLVSARLVIIERGPGNTAWYRLTAEGRRAAKDKALFNNARIEPTDTATQHMAEKRHLVAAGASSSTSNRR